MKIRSGKIGHQLLSKDYIVIEENLIVTCKTCGKNFETPFKLDAGEEHPDQCQECPPVDENGKLY